MDSREIAMHLTAALIEKQGVAVTTVPRFDEQAKENAERVASWYNTILKAITAVSEEERPTQKKQPTKPRSSMAF